MDEHAKNLLLAYMSLRTIEKMNREKAEARVKELEALFEMQCKRSAEANKLWQEATGRDCIPDLGALLEWLMKERTDLQAQVEAMKNCGNCGKAIVTLLGDIDSISIKECLSCNDDDRWEPE